MSELSNNAKISKSQVIKWEIVKSYEYTCNCLSEIAVLYVIKLTKLSDLYADNKPEVGTILTRISVTGENVFLNKAVKVEIMEGIFPYKLNSRKRNNTARLEDLYNYLCSIVNNNLPKEMLESLIAEYKNAANLFKTI